MTLEYKVYRMNNVNQDIEKVLNEYAADGWEFVWAHPRLPIVELIFKREKAAP